MRRWIVVCALVACSAVPGWAFKRVHVGEVHRDFVLEDLEGSPMHLAEALGTKATLVVFWAGWSPRSSEALRDYQALYQAHRADGLQVVAVDVAHQDWQVSELPGVRRFVAEKGLTYPVVIDRDLAVFNDYGVIAVPSTALLDPEGKIVALLEGYATTTRDDFRDRVLELLGVKQAVPVAAEATDTYRPKGKAERYFRMAEIMIEREMPRKAVHILKRALREDPDWPKPYRVLADVFEEEGRTDEAAEARARYAELTGTTTESHGASADVQERSKETPVARPSPAAAAAAARYLRMGALFLDKGMASQAENAFRKAVTKAPGSEAAHRKLAEVLEAQGKTEEARTERARAEALMVGLSEEQGGSEAPTAAGGEAPVSPVAEIERAESEPRETARPPVASGALEKGDAREGSGAMIHRKKGPSHETEGPPREGTAPVKGGDAGSVSRRVPPAHLMGEKPSDENHFVEQGNLDFPDPQEEP